MIFASPSGNEILRISGYRDAEQFLRVLQTIDEFGVGFTEYLTRVEKDPKDLLAQETLGQIYLNIGIYDKAKIHLQKALKALPSFQENVPSDQSENADSARKQAPGDSHEARILFLMSQASMAEKEYSKASKTLQNLIEKNPSSSFLPVYYLELGRAYLAWGKKDKAQDIFVTLNSKYPGSPQADMAKGLIK
jgi:tetratricopeptide (TPR) repeat protein